MPVLHLLSHKFYRKYQSTDDNLQNTPVEPIPQMGIEQPVFHHQ